jgi:uncharacterized membrane protein
MNNNLKRELPVLLVVILPFLYLGFIWSSLPERVPIHWNSEGQINGWGSKSTLLLLPLLLPLLTYILFSVTPLIDPKKKLDSMGNKFYQLKLSIVLLMSVLALFILYSTKNQSFFNPNLMLMLIGLLFAVFGNYFPSIKPNYFIGIKTPWTLENETVWKKTHQLAGKLWFPGGLIIIILAFIIDDPKLMHIIFLTITGIITIIPIVYSFIIFKKEFQKNT